MTLMPSGTCHRCREHSRILVWGRWCPKCYREAASLQDLLDASDAWYADPVPVGHLRCSWCNEVLPVADYYPSHFRPGGRCKTCCKANARRAYAGDPQPRK